MISVIGISYKTSNVEVREQFALAKEEIIPFSELLQKETDISDIVVLSTCNRSEIYFSQNKYDFHLASKLVYKTLKQFKGVQNKYWHTFYSYNDSEAVKHLFEVACGVDSMIIGEDQIVGQIKDAYVYCTEAALTDAVLMRLFQKSFEASKRVRTETQIKMGSTSVSNAAVKLCMRRFRNTDNFESKRVLLIGAGETGTLVLQHLHKKGVGDVTVTNRTPKKATALAARHKCTTMPIKNLSDELQNFDITIVATGSKVPLITKEMVKSASSKRMNNQIFIDISVPRNIEAEVENIEGIELFTIDDMQGVVNANLDMRRESLNSANKIIDEITEEYCEWLASRALRPTIKAITYNMLKISKKEVSSYNKINSEEMQIALNEFSKHLAQKYTRLFIKNLKDITTNGKKTEALSFVNVLFEIGND